MRKAVLRIVRADKDGYFIIYNKRYTIHLCFIDSYKKFNIKHDTFLDDDSNVEDFIRKNYDSNYRYS